MSTVASPATSSSFPSSSSPSTSTSSTSPTSISSSHPSSMTSFFSHISNSWAEELDMDPDTATHYPNLRSRQVFSGHYVAVEPTPLPDPTLLLASEDLAAEMWIDQQALRSDDFVKFFSGDFSVYPPPPTPSRSSSSSSEESSTAVSSSSKSKLTFVRSWCTPYALCIYGQPMYRNCPYGTGNGYGDGRAISVGEVLLNRPSSTASFPTRYELQLKGSGTTPFSRSADGRAVLRSSLREFVASECMHHLGVSTTRALSLVVSNSLTITRPWYSDAMKNEAEGGGENGEQGNDDDDASDAWNIDVDDPRLAHIPALFRRQFIEQIRSQFQSEAREPDLMRSEKAAITCRVAPSFLRVGHIDLFARRVAKQPHDEMRRKQLEKIVLHALFRDFPEADDATLSVGERALILLREARERIVILMADWIRVGYTQGNFNSDNCLVAGRTMDYGPFGFIEKYQPNWNMWIGGGEHFSFMNQPNAAEKNYDTLVNSVRLLADVDIQKLMVKLLDEFPTRMQQEMQRMWTQKLGFHSSAPWDQLVGPLFEKLESMMREHEVDYTILWRQLSYAPAIVDSWFSHKSTASDQPASSSSSPSSTSPSSSSVADELSELLSSKTDAELVRLIDFAFYESPKNASCRAARTSSSSTTTSCSTASSSSSEAVNCPNVKEWADWMRRWLLGLATPMSAGGESPSASSASLLSSVSASMKRVNPKYVPREWLLVQAYTAAEANDYSVLHRLMSVLRRPYDEQDADTEKWAYRRASRVTLRRGGTAYMSCSS